MTRPTITPSELSKDIHHILDAMKDGSPLACVLIGTAALEQAIGSLLTEFFVKGASTSESILDPNEGGILSAFMNRAKVAYCLGLISKTSYNNLNTVLSIRNRFAHSHLAVDFTDAKVIKGCMALTTMYDNLKEVDVGENKVKKDARTRFYVCVLGMYKTILLAAAMTEQRKAKKSEW